MKIIKRFDQQPIIVYYIVYYLEVYFILLANEYNKALHNFQDKAWIVTWILSLGRFPLICLTVWLNVIILCSNCEMWVNLSTWSQRLSHFYALQDGENIIFTYELFSNKDAQTGVITRLHLIAADLICSYPRDTEVDSSFTGEVRYCDCPYQCVT